jgi:hypothetical protein
LVANITQWAAGPGPPAAPAEAGAAAMSPHAASVAAAIAVDQVLCGARAKQHRRRLSMTNGVWGVVVRCSVRCA